MGSLLFYEWTVATCDPSILLIGRLMYYFMLRSYHTWAGKNNRVSGGSKGVLKLGKFLPITVPCNKIRFFVTMESQL